MNNWRRLLRSILERQRYCSYHPLLNSRCCYMLSVKTYQSFTHPPHFSLFTCLVGSASHLVGAHGSWVVLVMSPEDLLRDPTSLTIRTGLSGICVHARSPLTKYFWILFQSKWNSIRPSFPLSSFWNVLKFIQKEKHVYFEGSLIVAGGYVQQADDEVACFQAEAIGLDVTFWNVFKMVKNAHFKP